MLTIAEAICGWLAAGKLELSDLVAGVRPGDPIAAAGSSGGPAAGGSSGLASAADHGGRLADGGLEAAAGTSGLGAAGGSSGWVTDRGGSGPAGLAGDGAQARPPAGDQPASKRLCSNEGARGGMGNADGEAGEVPGQACSRDGSAVEAGRLVGLGSTEARGIDEQEWLLCDWLTPDRVSQQRLDILQLIHSRVQAERARTV